MIAVLVSAAAVAALCGLAQGRIAADAGARSYDEERQAVDSGMQVEETMRYRDNVDRALIDSKPADPNMIELQARGNELKASQDAISRDLARLGGAASADAWIARSAATRLGRLAQSFALLQAGALSAVLAALPKRLRPRLESWARTAAWGLGGLGVAAFGYAWLG